jgi:hypothetical protein
MFTTKSFLFIIFILASRLSICLAKTYGPSTKSEFIRQYNRTYATNMPSSFNTSLTCNACNKQTSLNRRVIVDTIAIIPVFQEVSLKKNQSPAHPKPSVVDSRQNKPTSHLRNGYYSQPNLKIYLRGSPVLLQNDKSYNPRDRYCYNIMQSIKSIIGM